MFRREVNIRMNFRGNRVGRYGLDVSGSGQRPVAGYSEHCNETWGSIKGVKFLD
jgi:hypothetical protein